MSHTPGPWTVQNADLSDPFNDVPWVLIPGERTVVVGGEHLTPADARLIAAAPDLLAALREAHGILQYNLGDTDPHVRAACDLMWKAIAAATGARETEAHAWDDSDADEPQVHPKSNVAWAREPHTHPATGAEVGT